MGFRKSVLNFPVGRIVAMNLVQMGISSCIRNSFSYLTFQFAEFLLVSN